MNNKSFFFYVLLVLMNPVFSYAATGSADVYKVTMEKIELCENATISSETSYSVSGCVTLGSGSLQVDIASVSAGQEVGKYASVSGLPIGTTYRYIQPTISRSFTIKGSVELTKINAGTDADCATDSDASKASQENYYTNAQGKYGETAEEQVVVVPTATANQGVTCLNTACTRVSTGGAISHDLPDDTTNYGSSISVPDTSSDSFTMVYALPTPYTVGVNPPKVTISFGTSTALQAFATYDSGGIGDGCVVNAYFPKVNMSITDQQRV